MEISDQRNYPAAYLLGKIPWYPFNRRMGGPSGWLGRFGDDKNLLTLTGNDRDFSVVREDVG